jgi:hypothetical protein
MLRFPNEFSVVIRETGSLLYLQFSVRHVTVAWNDGARRLLFLLKMSRIIARAKSVTWLYVYGGMVEGRKKGIQRIAGE